MGLRLHCRGLIVRSDDDRIARGFEIVGFAGIDRLGFGGAGMGSAGDTPRRIRWGWGVAGITHAGGGFCRTWWLPSTCAVVRFFQRGKVHAVAWPEVDCQHSQLGFRMLAFEHLPFEIQLQLDTFEQLVFDSQRPLEFGVCGMHRDSVSHQCLPSGLHGLDLGLHHVAEAILFEVDFVFALPLHLVELVLQRTLVGPRLNVAHERAHDSVLGQVFQFAALHVLVIQDGMFL